MAVSTVPMFLKWMVLRDISNYQDLRSILRAQGGAEGNSKPSST